MGNDTEVITLNRLWEKFEGKNDNLGDIICPSLDPRWVQCMFTMITERERHHLYYNQKDCRWFRKDSSSVYVLTPETSFHGDVFVWGYTTSQSSDHQSWDTSWGPPKQYDYAHRDKVMYLKSGTGPFIKAPTGVESKVNFFAVARMIDVETWDYLIGDTGGTNGWPGLENELKCYPYLKLAVERLLKK